MQTWGQRISGTGTNVTFARYAKGAASVQQGGKGVAGGETEDPVGRLAKGAGNQRPGRKLAALDETHGTGATRSLTVPYDD